MNLKLIRNNINLILNGYNKKVHTILFPQNKVYNIKCSCIQYLSNYVS